MSQVIHRPPAPPPGEWVSMIGHTPSADCVCKPERRTSHKPRSRGRGGRHQGYDVTVYFQHNPIAREVAS